MDNEALLNALNGINAQLQALTRENAELRTSVAMLNAKVQANSPQVGVSSPDFLFLETCLMQNSTTRARAIYTYSHWQARQQRQWKSISSGFAISQWPRLQHFVHVPVQDCSRHLP